MRHHPSMWEKIYAMHARAQQVCVEVQQTRWQAARTRHHARLARLARHMPEANSLTLGLTAVLLRQRRLLAHLTPYPAVARRPLLSDRTPAPSGAGGPPRSSTG
jgi:hypothetical protein